MKLDILKKAASTAKVVVFKLREVRPEIMLGVGAASVLAGTILACKKTKEAEPIVEHAKEELDELKFVSGTYGAEKPSVAEYARVIFRNGVKLVKVYGKSTILWVGGMVCIFGAHGELKSKNTKLLANTVALKKLFDDYREAVREEIGEEAEKALYFGAKDEEFEVEEYDEKTGEVKTVKTKGKVFRKQPGSMWARNYTPRTCDEFDTRTYNEVWIKKKVEGLNLDLKFQPFVTINDVYDALNLKPGSGRCAEGMTVGWCWNPKIDRGDREIRVEFLEGWEEVYDPVLDRVKVQPCLRLDFNCYPLEGLI